MAQQKRRPNTMVYGNLAYDLDTLASQRQLEEAARPERKCPAPAGAPPPDGGPSPAAGVPLGPVCHGVRWQPWQWCWSWATSS